MTRRTRATGGAAAAAGVLMTAGVEGEWVLNPQRADGTVTHRAEFALLLTLSTLGFVLLALAVAGLRRETAGPARAARFAGAASLVGAILLAAFGALVLVSGLVSGAPLGASFLAFALGLLLLSVGQVVWGVSMRGRSPAPGVWQVLAGAGVMAFAAVAIPFDPWHDVALVTMFLAWSAIGVLLLRRSSGSAAPARSSRPGRQADAAHGGHAGAGSVQHGGGQPHVL